MISFLSAFLSCLVLTPFVIKFATKRELFDIPDQRKLHDEDIPRLGGVAIAGAFLIGILLSATPETIYPLRFFLAGLIMLFFVGLWDDLKPVKPLIKISGEVLPLIILAVNSTISLSAMPVSFIQIRGMEWIFTVFMAFWIVNAFNLIDGINGLAGTIGLIALAGTALLFPETGPVCLSMCGAVLAFLFFNFIRPKIFMGDSGSLLIGYCITYLMTILPDKSPILLNEIPSWVIILPLASLPMFDMGRVFIIRAIHGKNPFQGDRNHLHHLLLETGLSHLGATLYLSLLTVINAVAVIGSVKMGATPFAGILLNIPIPLFFTMILWRRVKKIRNDIHSNNNQEANPLVEIK